MSEHVGVWIDHDKAFVVTLHDGREDVVRIGSNVEGHVRLPGGGPTLIVPEGSPERRHTEHLRLFYGKVVKVLTDAAALYVFGPGEAKGELAKEIRKSKSLAARIVAVEPADKMTERQMAARVREFYAKSGKGGHPPQKGGLPRQQTGKKDGSSAVRE